MRYMKDNLTANFYTVDSQIPSTECDSLSLPVLDSVTGEFSGCYGIRKGHTKAVFLLKEGNVILKRNKKTVLSVKISGGFAMVENNEVNITTDSIEK